MSAVNPFNEDIEKAIELSLQEEEQKAIELSLQEEEQKAISLSLKEEEQKKAVEQKAIVLSRQEAEKKELIELKKRHEEKLRLNELKVQELILSQQMELQKKEDEDLQMALVLSTQIQVSSIPLVTTMEAPEIIQIADSSNNQAQQTEEDKELQKALEMSREKPSVQQPQTVQPPLSFQFQPVQQVPELAERMFARLKSEAGMKLTCSDFVILGKLDQIIKVFKQKKGDLNKLTPGNLLEVLNDPTNKLNMDSKTFKFFDSFKKAIEELVKIDEQKEIKKSNVLGKNEI